MAYDISPLEFLVKGAPVDHMLSEGIADIIALAVLKGAPHPNTAWLFTRWALSEEGQKAYSLGGRTPAHPKVEPAKMSGRRPFTRIEDKTNC
jgi:ABC-type Fe3+ transport system substrate-binding protein